MDKSESYPSPYLEGLVAAEPESGKNVIGEESSPKPMLRLKVWGRTEVVVRRRVVVRKVRLGTIVATSPATAPAPAPAPAPGTAPDTAPDIASDTAPATAPAPVSRARLVAEIHY